MAEEKQTYLTRLYDAEGNYVGEVEGDQNLMFDANLRSHTVEHGGKTYAWNQRMGRWQEAGEAIRLSGKMTKAEEQASEAVQNTPPELRSAQPPAASAGEGGKTTSKG